MWASGRSKSESKPLLKRFDYHQQLSAQFPLQDHRVVYTKSGTTLVAARLPDGERSIIDHKLYWGAFVTIAEARYITGLFNSQVLEDRTRRYQAKGLFGARDFDKYVFRAGIGIFDGTSPNHLALVEIVERAEAVASGVSIEEGSSNLVARKRFNRLWRILAWLRSLRMLLHLSALIRLGCA